MFNILLYNNLFKIKIWIQWKHTLNIYHDSNYIQRFFVSLLIRDYVYLLWSRFHIYFFGLDRGQGRVWRGFLYSRIQKINVFRALFPVQKCILIQSQNNLTPLKTEISEIDYVSNSHFSIKFLLIMIPRTDMSDYHSHKFEGDLEGNALQLTKHGIS